MQAAVRFTRRHGLVRAVRLAAAGLVTLGPRGLVRRDAADARQAEDDARYAAWLPNHILDERALHQLGTEVAAAPLQPRISILMAVYNTHPDWLRRCIHSVVAQIYPGWELCVCDDGSTDPETVEELHRHADHPRIRIVRSASNGGIVRASRAALSLARGEFVGFLDHDDELAPDALAEIVRRINEEPDVDVIHTDEDKIDERGVHREPHFKPDWSPDLLRSCMYVSHFTVMRRSVVERCGGFREGTDGAQDHDLMLRVSEATSKIAHVPRVLYHWRASAESAAASQLSKRWTIGVGRRVVEDHLSRLRIDAQVAPGEAAGHYRISYAAPPSGSVMVIGIAEKQAWPLFTKFVKRGQAYFSGVTEVSQLNAAVRAGTAEHLVIASGAPRPTSRSWLETLAGYSRQPGIGAAGGIVLGKDGAIDSAGLVTIDGTVLPAFRGEPQWTRGHLGNVLDARNCAAVDSACLATTREVFERVGGFDEAMLDGWNVDYCLRVRDAGLRVVIAPQVVLERGSGSAMPSAAALERLRERWQRELTRDPYYNPNFARERADFRLPDSR
jgi:GT2 family glycosyltransferase